MPKDESINIQNMYSTNQSMKITRLSRSGAKKAAKIRDGNKNQKNRFNNMIK